MKKILIGLIVIIMFTACSNKSKLEDILKENNYIILDVRTKEEYQEGHVINALNIPYDEIDENINLSKNKTILVYCRSGKRSQIAYNTLKKYGYDVYDMGAYDSVLLDKVNN